VLYLLIVDKENYPLYTSRTILKLREDRELFGKIEKLNTLPVSPGFKSFLRKTQGNPQFHWGSTAFCSKGLLRTLSIKDLLDKDLILDFRRSNMPAFQYLWNLPEDTSVVLYWD